MLGIMKKMSQVIQPDDPAINVDWDADENARRVQIKVSYDVKGQFIASFMIDVDKIHGRIVVDEVETADSQPNSVLFTPIAVRFRKLIAGTGIVLVLNLHEDPYKLYVWHGVLCDHTAGVIFALARSVNEARQVVIMDALQNADWAVKSIEAETAVAPEVYDSPVGFFLYGGG